MTYRDRTFCMAACLTLACPKNWQSEVARYYELPEPRPDVAMAILSEGCPDYQPVKANATYPAREALAE